jgi:rare lipoprotein A
MGSVLTVSANGRTIQCRVNDRGPFVRGRVVDLSIPAARALGMMRAGVVHVSVQ